MQYVTQFYPPVVPGFFFAFLPLLIAIAIITIILKGYALWHAARNTQTWWFVALLVINTAGILEIIYLIWFRPKSPAIETAPAHDSSAQA